MKKTKLFDVLVVYTDGIATSASSRNPKIQSPFGKAGNFEQYDRAYAYFLEICEKNNLKAAFTISKDIIGPGLCQSYWLFQQKKWIKVNNLCYSEFIFDKISPVVEKQRARRTILFSDFKIKPFNNPQLYALLSDKQKTYEYFKEFAIPTVAIEKNTYADVDQAIQSLKHLVAVHPHSQDFFKEIVIKDRFGAGGDSIFRINARKPVDQILDILKKSDLQFVLQPFAKFENGYQYNEYRGFIDIRIIYVGSKAIQAYIRIAKKNEFRCNEHQGGTIEYLAIKDIPLNVVQFSHKILESLDEKKALCALDFIVSDNGNVYLMEGNIGPGIYWNSSMKDDERMSKKLIREIVKEIFLRIRPVISIPHLPPVTIPENILFPQVTVTLGQQRAPRGDII